MSKKMAESAENYDKIADELELALRHYRTAANHFREKEVPRGCAHAYAGWGHVNKAEAILKSESINHAENSQP